MAPLVDAVMYDSSNALQSIVNFLDIPTPDSACIVAATNRADSLVFHLIRLLSASERTTSCVEYMRYNMYYTDLLESIENCRSLVMHMFPISDRTTAFYSLILDWDDAQSGIERLTQLAAYKCDNAVIEFLLYISPQRMSCSIDMVAMMVIMKNPTCQILKTKREYRPRQCEWILKNLCSRSLEVYLKRVDSNLTVQVLEPHYRKLLKRGMINFYVVKMLLYKGMKCNEQDILATVVGHNMFIMQAIIEYCPRWRPSVVLNTLKLSALKNVTKICYIQWIREFLKGGRWSSPLKGEASNPDSYTFRQGWFFRR